MVGIGTEEPHSEDSEIRQDETLLERTLTEDDEDANAILDSIVLTIRTVVSLDEAPQTEDVEAESVHSDFEIYRTSPITFEEFFMKSDMQRLFITNVLKFQVYLSISSVLPSLACTILTDHAWFFEAGDELLNALLLHSVILSTFMLLIPFVMYKLRKRKVGIGKYVIEALVRVYQASLFVFWFAFACGKIWYPEDETRSNNVFPLYYMPCMYYSLNLLHQLVLIVCIRVTQIEIRNRSALGISALTTAAYLAVSLPLALTQTVGRGFVICDTLQILGASFYSFIESSVTFYTAFLKTRHKLCVVYSFYYLILNSSASAI